MKKAIPLAVLLAITPLMAAAETWSNVALIDVMCATKFKDKPDEHSAKCALQCQQSGFGIVTADGDFLKLDEAGNKQAVTLLKSAPKDKPVRVTVTGERTGDSIKVEQIRM